MGPPPLPRPQRNRRLATKLSSGDNAATPEVSMHRTDNTPDASQARGKAGTQKRLPVTVEEVEDVELTSAQIKSECIVFRDHIDLLTVVRI